MKNFIMFGPNSFGRTTLSLQLVKKAINSGGTLAYIDSESTLDLDHWLRRFGLENAKRDPLIVTIPNNIAKIAHDQDAIEKNATLLTALINMENRNGKHGKRKHQKR